MGRSLFSPTDGPLMLRRVLEDPADDAPRLTYADWLEEAGEEERAEFIRVQIAEEKYLPCETSEKFRAVHDNRHWFPMFDGGWGLSVFDLKFEKLNAVLVRRGFISEIRLTCEQFVGGGECKSCQGSGMSAAEYHGMTDDDGGCVSCNGTGHIEGLAKRIFSEHPVVRVVLTDKRPHPSYNGGFYWATYEENQCREAHHVPRPLDQFIPHARWDTEHEALDAISAACVAYGRSLANLPPLPTTH